MMSRADFKRLPQFGYGSPELSRATEEADDFSRLAMRGNRGHSQYVW